MSGDVAAQVSEMFVRPQGFIRVMPMIQSWSVQRVTDFGEVSVPLQMYLPLHRRFTVSLRSHVANTIGDPAKIQGVTDTQIGLNLIVPEGGLVFHTRFNLPSGKERLTPTQFNTASTLSLNAFRMQVPLFGQGFNVMTGISWAIPMSEQVVFGIGGAWHYRGAFTPLSNDPALYEPGSEFILTGGIDIRLSEETTMTLDGIIVNYKTDRFDGIPVFEAGSQVVSRFQFRRLMAFDELRGYLRIRYRSKNSRRTTTAGFLAIEPERTTPVQFEIGGRYRKRLSRAWYLSVPVEGRFFKRAEGYVDYQHTPASSGVYLLGAGIVPERRVSPRVFMDMRIMAYGGGISGGSRVIGLEGALSLTIRF